MKIGILTFHRAHNYGAVLQCYALQQSLKKIGGAGIEVIDYRQPYIEENYAVFSFKQFVRKTKNIKSIASYLREIGNRRIRKNNFGNFVKLHLNMTGRCTSSTIPNNFSSYIIGSDQLWSSNHIRGVDKVYWGQFQTNEDALKFSYAISSNKESLSAMGSERVRRYIKSFQDVSCRELDIATLICQLTGRECRQDIDPVLLTTEDDWKSIINTAWHLKQYILIYQIGAPNGDYQILPKKAKQIAEERGWEVIDVTNKLVSPEDFVSLFKYAQLVLTTSFHGTAFSVLFGKQFYTISVNEKIDMRAKGLLNSLDLGVRHIDIESNISESMINYRVVHSKLNKLRKDSLNYLKYIIDETVSRSK